jgi:hypothetical protein
MKSVLRILLAVCVVLFVIFALFPTYRWVSGGYLYGQTRTLIFSPLDPLEFGDTVVPARLHVVPWLIKWGSALLGAGLAAAGLRRLRARRA